MNITSESKSDPSSGTNSTSGPPVLAAAREEESSKFSVSLETQQKQIDQKQEDQKRITQVESSDKLEQKLPVKGNKLPVDGSPQGKFAGTEYESELSTQLLAFGPAAIRDQIGELSGENLASEAMLQEGRLNSDSMDELPLVNLLVQSYQLTGEKPHIQTGVESDSLELSGEKLKAELTIVTPPVAINKKVGSLTDLSGTDISELAETPEGVPPLSIVENMAVDIVPGQGGVSVPNAPVSDQVKQLLVQIDGEAPFKGTVPVNQQTNLQTSQQILKGAAPVLSEPDSFLPGSNIPKIAVAEITDRSEFTKTLLDKAALDMGRNFVPVGSLPVDADATQQLRTVAQQIAPAIQNAGVQVASEAMNTTRTMFLMNTPLGEAGWEQEIGSRVRWMVGQDQQIAELKLNPPHLGVLEIRITTDEEKTKVTFFAQNPNTKELMEGNMPRLRDLLASAGIDLGDTEISHQSFGERDQNSAMADKGSGHRSDAGLDTEDINPTGVLMSTQMSRQSNGIVDTFI